MHRVAPIPSKNEIVRVSKRSSVYIIIYIENTSTNIKLSNALRCPVRFKYDLVVRRKQLSYEQNKDKTAGLKK